MLAVFNRAISRCSSCTLWRNSSIVVATVRFYTRGVRSVHKTEHLSAAFGSIAPVTPKKFFPYDPRPEQICIEDIAHGLSMLCRFVGQCRFFFSVAEHSIAVARLLPANLKLFGLLHDASEAYLADLPRPVKAGLPEYKAIETNVERVIAEKFELPFPMPPEVKAADQALLKDEVFSFFGTQRYFEDFGEEYSGEGAARLLGLSPQIAESRFLYLYRSLS